MTAMPDPAAPTLLPGPAVSRRTFVRNDTLTVFTEIYDNISGTQPRQIETSVALVNESGQDVFNARDTVDNPSTGRWTTYGLARDVPLGTVAPGRYLLRLEANHRGESGAVARETLITVQ
jgi:hypothetical protein